MGLTYGSGPLGKTPAGTFNFQPPPPGRALLLEPSPKRVRVRVAGETIADSRRAMLLQEGGAQPVYYFPAEDVRTELLTPTDTHTHCPKKGDASYYTIEVGDRVLEDSAWYYPEPLAEASFLSGLIAFYFDRMDTWLEEDEEIHGHPRDPYHRIDTIPTGRHIRISVDGELVAETQRAVALFEASLPTRWYLPREDVVVPLEASQTHTYCPYKGQASYLSPRLRDGSLAEDLVWYYPEPLLDATRVRDLLCFYNERVDIELDGETQERP